MPKIYYQCSRCHSKVKRDFDILDRYGQKCFGGKCKKCQLYMILYSCQHNYWWELLYLTIRDIIRKII